MIALLQRVLSAAVVVGRESVGEIGPGLLVFIGVERGDDEAQGAQLLRRLLSYRIFADADGKMNLSLLDTHGDLLLVPQFTLAADTASGLRPSFSTAEEPVRGRFLFERMADEAQSVIGRVATGRFGADMRVSLVNDGPVTFLLRTKPDRPGQTAD